GPVRPRARGGGRTHRVRRSRCAGGGALPRDGPVVRRSLGLGLYVPGTTVLHRIPPGPKLLALVILSIVVVAAHGPWIPVGVFATAIVVALGVGIPRRALVASLRPLLLIMLIAVSFQWWTKGWETALEVLATV